MCNDKYSDMAFKWKQIVPINAKFIHHNILYNLKIYDSIEIKCSNNTKNFVYQFSVFRRTITCYT